MKGHKKERVKKKELAQSESLHLCACRHTPVHGFLLPKATQEHSEGNTLMHYGCRENKWSAGCSGR